VTDVSNKVEAAYIWKLHYRLGLIAMVGITGLPSYRRADCIVSLFFKEVNNSEGVNPYHLQMLLLMTY
jgi:hypothetical protein